MDKKAEILGKNDHTLFAVKKVASDNYSKSDISEGLYSAICRRLPMILAQIIKLRDHRATIKGDMAAIKTMSGDASSEIRNTYLVYEFAENGSLSDWLHRERKHGRERFSGQGWKQRVQIAHDIANGLHYLHNYTSPGYVPKDIKNINVLLDGEFRALLILA
ncbi:hypothetical protein AMTRI_Chr08g205630 [Amborella trichopoda]